MCRFVHSNIGTQYWEVMGRKWKSLLSSLKPSERSVAQGRQPAVGSQGTGPPEDPIYVEPGGVSSRFIMRLLGLPPPLPPDRPPPAPEAPKGDLIYISSPVMVEKTSAPGVADGHALELKKCPLKAVPVTSDMGSLPNVSACTESAATTTDTDVDEGEVGTTDTDADEGKVENTDTDADEGEVDSSTEPSLADMTETTTIVDMHVVAGLIESANPCNGPEATTTTDGPDMTTRYKVTLICMTLYFINPLLSI